MQYNKFDTGKRKTLHQLIYIYVHVNFWENTYAYNTVQYDFLFLKSPTHPQLKSHMVHLLTIKFLPV